MRIFISTPLAERDFANEIGAALRKDSHEVFDAFSIEAASIESDVTSAIFNADLLVAVLTETSPNVFYEVGVAAAIDKPTLLTGAPDERLPSNLVSVPYVQRSGDNVRDAQEIARRALSMAGSRPQRVQVAAGGSAESRLSEAAQSPSVLASISPLEFESLLARFFEEQGLEVSSQSEARDWGVDFLVDLGEPVAIEVKKLSAQSLVPAAAVSGLLSMLAVTGASLGVLLSTSGFTAGAMAVAEGTRVALLTLDQLLADPTLTSAIAKKAPPSKRAG